MLLFSTILEIDQRLTKDDFINLVIEWNQKGHPESVISGIEWNGERNIRFEDENKCLEIQEYRNKNIIAARFEKREPDGAVWDTDYIMNFSEMKMAIRLDRSYIEEALNVDTKFFTPFFISMLIDRGYILKDGNLEVRRTPLIIDEENLDLIVNVINGTAKYKLPVVIITKTFFDEDPVDANKLAKELKGVAHVLVQETNCTNLRLKELCNGNNEYYGAIGIYHPNPAIGHRRYLYRMSEGIDRILSDKVTRIVMQYSNSQLVGSLYTWFGVNNAILQDRLASKREENAKAESGRKKALYELLALKSDLDQKEESIRKKAVGEAKEEADKILEDFEEDMQKKDSEIERLTSELQKKEYEISWLRAKLDSMTEIPVLVAGDEDDFYPGEAKDFVLSAVKKELSATEPRTRRYDVLKDILDANDYKAIGEQRAEDAKRLLSVYDGMTPRLKKSLEDIGFVFDKSDHQKVKYYGDDRYTIIYASTPSDRGHGGKNNVRTTIKKAF
ncbi:hypothetical protein [Clostridium sp. AM42-4]|uniref:hypothetical protein n=1 Tax=Clostridium sp. AM42-4 TaxID=2292305 RepID=UPI000E4A131E|nr:hypothetical protein [Clostridium sp. AM42-4]RHS91012.1 hypothetical protein DW922_00900 [Clostridium sp. AM42-4]